MFQPKARRIANGELIADCQLPIADWFLELVGLEAIGNWQLAIGNLEDGKARLQVDQTLVPHHSRGF